MRFNRRISTIKAISFDLDDTLYSNRQVMINTDAAMVAYFQRLASKYNLSNQQYDFNFWQPYRQQALAAKPELTHDVTQARIVTYQYGFAALGMPTANIDAEVADAMAYFLSHRNQVKVPKNIHHFLTQLSQHFPLVAISNGNVDTDIIGISKYFRFIFHAGNGFKQKPNNDLFHLALNKLNLQPKELLHVGDCGYADIKGAIRAGCQSAWLNCYDVGKPIRQLPDIELNQVTDLADLLLPNLNPQEKILN